ncbi:unnamed protein product [Phytophthora lilii]|uniref:Unnamed protein product n=1 Tax=Phytophthora lilii TaxID=2077276 RepID=A0A9W6TB73_9STRA|nr:unnamed protein product [Phytophthora lilii]
MRVHCIVLAALFANTNDVAASTGLGEKKTPTGLLDEEDADDEERGIKDLAAKLNDNEMRQAVRAVSQKNSLNAFAHLQSTGLSWQKREAKLWNSSTFLLKNEKRCCTLSLNKSGVPTSNVFNSGQTLARQ